MILPHLSVRLRTPYQVCYLACPYCIKRAVRNKGEPFNIQRFRDIIQKLLQLPFTVNLHLGVEGEIFTSPDLLEEIVTLCNSHNNLQTVSFLSSIDADWNQVIGPFLSSLDTRKLGMGCTLHDLVIPDIESFFRKVARILDAGVAVYVTHVAIPGRIAHIQNYFHRCRKLGVPLILNSLIGQAKNIPGIDPELAYPQSYGERERESLRDLWDTPHSYQMLIHASSPRGMKCTAGSRYVFIEPNGEVFPCSKIKTSLGNILTADVRFLQDPLICPSDRCWCGNQNQALCIVDEYYQRTRNVRMFHPKQGIPVAQLYAGYNPSIFPDRPL
jgi:MoaA/NifB/PqqE/SkfB family radical SAM enzyme